MSEAARPQTALPPERLPRPLWSRVGTRGRYGRGEAQVAYLLIAPAMLRFVVFVVLPAGTALYLSFTEYDILTQARWIGLDNFRRLQDDSLFHRSLRNIVTYAALYVPGMIALSLLLATALNRKWPGMTFFRAVYYLPVMTSPVAAATTSLATVASASSTPSRR